MTRRIALSVAVVVALALCVSAWREHRAARAEIARLRRAPGQPRDVPADLRALPAPVARYLRFAVPDGRTPGMVRFHQRGELRTDTASDRWLSFEAEQVMHQEAGFIWRARVSLAPLVSLGVRDALIDGEGSGRLTLWSAIPLAAQDHRPEVTSGSLHRYLAEGVWCPGSLLPSESLTWTAIDDTRAAAALTRHGVTVTLEFRFAPGGEVTSIYTPGRWGSFAEGYRQVPWEGHFRRYQRRNGLVVPTDADVGWRVAGEWRRVWQGRIERFELEDAAR